MNRANETNKRIVLHEGIRHGLAVNQRFIVTACSVLHMQVFWCTVAKNLKPALMRILFDGRCFKILNTNGLPKGPRQMAQTQIRLLPRRQSDLDIACLLFCQAFCEFQP